MIFRKRLRRNIEGTPISYITNVAEIDKLSCDDYLMISQPDCIADVLDGGYWKSEAVPFDVFAKQISADVYRAFGFGSMVNECSSDYSKAVHVHPQYSGLSVQSFCSNRRDPTLCSLVTFEDDGMSENVSIPSIAKPTLELAQKIQLAPKIGEMRMFGAKSYALIAKANHIELDMSSPNFSGWAIPDGSPIDKDRFPGAYEVFGSSLPAVEGNLVKLNPFQYSTGESSDAAALIGQQEPIPTEQHQHDISIGSVQYYDESGNVQTTVNANFKYRTNYKIAIDETRDWSDAHVDNDCGSHLEYGATPCPCTSKVLLEVALNVQSTVDTSDIDVTVNPASDKVKTMPSYTNLLALVYVGKPFSMPSTSGIDSNANGLMLDSQYAVYMPN